MVAFTLLFSWIQICHIVGGGNRASVLNAIRQLSLMLFFSLATQSLRTELTTTQTALAFAQLELTVACASVELATSKEAVHKDTVEEFEDTQYTMRALRQALAKTYVGLAPYDDSTGSHTDAGRNNSTYTSQMDKNRSESGLGMDPFGIAAEVSSAKGTDSSSKAGHSNSHAKDSAAGSQDSKPTVEAAGAQTAVAIEEAKACVKVFSERSLAQCYCSSVSESPSAYGRPNCLYLNYDQPFASTLVNWCCATPNR